MQEALDRIMREKTRTIVVIAHRLSTIKNADRIAVMYKGKIVELGEAEKVMNEPEHEYIKSLLAAIPKLHRG